MKILCIKNKLIRLIFVLGLLSPVSVHAQSTTWQRIFGGQRGDFGNEFFETTDGNYFLISERMVISLNTGFPIPQTYFAKFNIYGNLIWGKYYGDSIKPNYPSSAIEIPSGNIIISYVNNNKGNLLKIDSFGSLIWDYTYPPPITGFYNLSLINNKENLIVNGDQPGVSFYIPNVSKLDTNGNIKWTRSYSYERIPIGYYVDENGFYEVGQDSFDSGFIIKRDTSGFVIWQKILTNVQKGNLFRLFSMAPVSPSTFISIGQRCSPFCGMYATKFDSSGTISWERHYWKDTLSGRRITRSSNNEFAIAGFQGLGKGQLSIIDSLGNIKLKKYHYYDSENLVSYDFINTCNSSGFLISGNFKLSSQEFSDILVMKTDNNFNFNQVGIAPNGLIQNNIFSFDTYPNPFNPTLNIKIYSSENDAVSIDLIDIIGREYRLISNQTLLKGYNLLSFNVSGMNLSSGIYMLKFKDETFESTKKIIYLK